MTCTPQYRPQSSRQRNYRLDY